MSKSAGHSPTCFCEACIRAELDSGPCMGRAVCVKCGRFYGYCSEVEASLTQFRDSWSNPPKEQTEMELKRSKAGRDKFVKRDFLKSKDIPVKGGTAKVIEFRVAPKQMEYSDYLVDISMGKKEYTIGLRKESVLLDMLIDELGSKTEKWAGKSVKLVRGGPKGQYVNVE